MVHLNDAEVPKVVLSPLEQQILSQGYEKWLKSKINLDGDSFTAPRNSIQTIKRHNSVGVYYGQLLESQIIEKPIKQENFEYNSEDFPELSCSMSKLKVEETKQIKEKTMSLKEISKKILN